MTSSDNRRQVSRRDLKQRPYLLWNAYVDLLAMGEYVDLTPRQRIAHLAFWYDSEVQNGGHLQFFENRGGRHLENTLDALRELGAEGQRQVLSDAISQIRSSPRRPIQTIEEFVARALEGEFDNVDAAYHEVKPSMAELLEKYLDRYTDEFVQVME
jgi:hypothetical protein